MNRKQARFPGDPDMREKMQKYLPALRKLSKLDESYEALNGLSFDDLDLDRQRSFESYSISYMVIPLDTPKADVFEVYEDINSGGENLTQQQVRRAVFSGPYMKMIDELKDTCNDFHAIRSPKAFASGSYETCKKDSDGELILRAFSFRNRGEQFTKPIKKFLNRELEGRYVTTDKGGLAILTALIVHVSSSFPLLYSEDFDSRTVDEKRRLQVQQMVLRQRSEFESVLRVARQVFGDRAFRKIRKKQDTISATLWDAKFCAIAELLTVHREIDFTKAKDRIASKLHESLETGFLSEDDNVTSGPKFIARKDQLKAMMQDAINHKRVPRDRRRNFSTKLKHDLFERQNGLCGLCEQTIDQHRLEERNYVHIDHIIPHSKGGVTGVSNAQLTHRECNLHKSAGNF